MDDTVLLERKLEAERADQIRRRLRAIEGQVRGLTKMIDGGRPCLEVLMQLSAAQEALSGG